MSARTIRPSGNYITEKHLIGNISAISAASSIDVVYHQTSCRPYAEIYASDNVMQFVLLKEKGGELTVCYAEGIEIRGESRCRVDVYSPSVSCFTTYASGDISIPEGLDTDRNVKMNTYASGDVEVLDVNCTGLEACIYASGNIMLKKVSCSNASLSIYASGDCGISALDCEGKGKAQVYASGDIEASGVCGEVILGNFASGDIDMESLKAKSAEVEIFGSGDVVCHVSGSIMAKSFGSGTLTYFGNPSRCDTEGKNINRR